MAGKEEMNDPEPVSNDGSVSNYLLYATCKVKLGDKKEALKEMAYFVNHMPKLGEQEKSLNRPPSQKAGAVNTMHLWENLRDWYSENNEIELAKTCNDEVIKYAQQYHLEHLVVEWRH